MPGSYVSSFGSYVLKCQGSGVRREATGHQVLETLKPETRNLKLLFAILLSTRRSPCPALMACAFFLSRADEPKKPHSLFGIAQGRPPSRLPLANCLLRPGNPTST